MGSNKEIKEQFSIAPGKDDAGKPIFSVLVKRTYDIKHNQQATRAENSLPLNVMDTYYDHGDPQWATIKYESDMVPYKIATDFIVIGKAYAPKGIPIMQMDASVEVSNVKKTIRIIGDRKCIFRGEKKSPVFTEPIEFNEMEIRYERAYGGKDEISEPNLPLMYPRNYMGKGFAVKNIPEVIDGLLLPNLEDPNDLITPENLVLEDIYLWNRKPLPQGFGWFQKTWYPRSSFVGAVPGFVMPDEVMKEEILGIVPKGQIALSRQFKLPSFDVRFNNGASLGLVLPFLSGGESVKLTNMSKDGALEFKLPKDTPKIMLDIGLGENELKPYIHTVCVRVDDMQVDIVWRGAHEYPGIDWLPEMTKMETNIA
jgi:hypothetical protein